MTSRVIKRIKLRSPPSALDRYHFDLPIESDQFPLLTQNYPSGLHQQTHVHRHPEAEISYYPYDSGVMLMEEQEVPFKAGDIFLINGDTFHQPVFDKKSNSGLFVLYFLPELFDCMPDNWEQLATIMSPGMRGYCRLSDNARAQQLVLEAHQTFYRREGRWEMLCQGILLHLLSFFARESSEQRLRLIPSRELKDIQKIRRTQKYIKNHLSENIAIEELCKVAELSRSQFYEKFRDIAGCSAKTWLRNVRLDYAQRLLRYTSKTVTEISYSCGFSCPSYFNRVFFKETGMTPSSYRQLDTAI